MGGRTASRRPEVLAERLREAAAALIALVQSIDDDRWSRVPRPGVWSIGKDAEHVSEAASYHQWIVGITIARPLRRGGPPSNEAG